MLELVIQPPELYDEESCEFVTMKEQTLRLEHSLLSVSKWESKWCKPFLSRTSQTVEEMVDYVRCMTITQNVDPKIYLFITDDHIQKINDYIEAPMTATTFSEERKKITNRDIVTSEIIYHWMIAYNIPFECQKWHLTKLLTLINVCNIKNNPPKKMSRKELLARNRTLNESRKQALKTKG